MYGQLKDVLNTEIAAIREAGLYKDERIIESAQAAAIKVAGGEVINFCANNYLGLSSHPKVVDAARKSLDTWGYGMSSVRFICGTQTIHKELEAAISRFLGTDDAILYSSCFDANGGLFETLLGAEDCIISDELNHASIIDGVRLCKAERMRYKNSDMNDLEKCLKESQKHRLRMIATDGVFSMDGTIAKLKDICDLAEKYHAIVMVDDSHATGFIGKTGRGTPEFNGVMARVDVITSTLGKAMGGASGGFTTGRREIVEMLRQRSRPYLFSNSVAPPIVAASLAVVGLLGAEHRSARPPGGEHALLPHRHGCGGLQHRRRDAPHLSHHAGRRQTRARRCARHAGRGHLRDRLQLPGGAQGQGAHPRADLGGPHEAAPRPGAHGVQKGGEEARAVAGMTMLPPVAQRMITILRVCVAPAPVRR